MLLAIDNGNTNVVFAVYDGDRALGTWRCQTDVKRTADEYAVWLTQLMALKGLKPEDVTASIIASVVPGALFNLITLCNRYFGREPLVVGTDGVDLGMEVLIDHPEQAGADRLVNAVAAQRHYGGPAVIIDFGTATTFDVIDGDGNFRGSAFAPGINLSMEALYMAAARLPRIEIKPTEKIIGKATVPAMQSGIYWGYVGMIEGLVERIRKESGEPMKVYATGGLAALFDQATEVFDIVDPELTMKGLVEIDRRNRRA